jgi:hypothetical protein
MSTEVKADIPSAIEFLRAVHPKGPWLLTAISVDKQQIKTSAFSPQEESKAVSWLAKYVDTHNIYWSVNRVSLDRPDRKGKAQKQDVTVAMFLHVDVDPRAGEDIQEERERAIKLLEAYEPKPTIVISSGGGAQAFWALDPEVPMDGTENCWANFEQYNIQLSNEFGGDNCHNIDRIMRLPGTVNFPDAKKVKKGRKIEKAVLVRYSPELTYGLENFHAAPKVQVSSSPLSEEVAALKTGNVTYLNSVDELDKYKIPDWLKVLIVQGCDPDDPSKFASRSEALFACVCQLVRCEVPPEVIFAVITDEGFAISASVLDSKRPDRYALKQIRSAQEVAIHPMLAQLNKNHAVISDIGGSCKIISETYDPGLKRTRISNQSFSDFRNRYCNQMVEVGSDEKGKALLKPAGSWWITHANRRQYDMIVFAPGEEVPGAYNLWCGFAVEPRRGNLHLGFLEHIKRNICQGREDLYAYVCGWMARAVQHPDTPGEIAIILRGKQGTGKSFFAKVFGGLFGRHFMQVSDPKHLVGSFNAHLRDCVVLFADEAFYAGDKKHESVLKTLITEEMIVLEGKGVDAQAMRNFIHLIMASNYDWVVPSGPEERRYLVLDIGEDNLQDKAYFQAMRDDLDNGGQANLLEFLLSYDLSGFEVRDRPTTKGLQDQKMLSLSPEHEWWYGKLLHGQLPGSPNWSKEVEVQCVDLHQDYIRSLQELGHHRKFSSPNLARFLEKFYPDEYLKVRRGRMTFQRRAEVTTYSPDGFCFKKKARPYFYELPKLEVMRQRWDEVFGTINEWKDVVFDDTEETDGPEAF